VLFGAPLVRQDNEPGRQVRWYARSGAPLNVDVDLNWRQDLNFPTCIGETSCVNSTGTADRRTALFEHNLEAATPIPVIRKPFGAIAEGLVLENSRGDRTPLELFIAGVRACDVEVRRRLAQESNACQP